MLVKDWMSIGVMSIRAEDSIQQAIKLQKDNNITMLPVMEKGRMVGIVTSHDLKSASFPDALPVELQEAIEFASKVKVKEIMSHHPLTVLPEHTMEEAANILLKNRISGAPVVDDKGKIVGIITRSDILKVLMEISGKGKISYEVAFCVKDQPGSVKEIVNAVHKHNGRIASILSSHKGVAPGLRNMYMRLYNVEPEEMPEIIKQLKKKATLRYFIDFIMNKREIYSK